MSTALRNGSTVLDSYGYAYDSNGSRTNVLRMNGSQVAYGYDNLGQLTSATGFDPDGSLRGNENFGYLYDPANNLLVRTNNTLVQAFTTDRANELVNVSLENNLLTVVGSLTNHPSSLKINGQNATIYNDLTFAVTNGVAVQSGLNVFTAVVSSGQLMTNSLREVLPASVNLRYDLNGNLVWDGMKGYGYDCANELTSITVTDAWQTKLVYDGFGRRRVKQEYTWSGNGWTKTNEVHYVYDGMTVIQERDANNNPLVSYTRGLDLSGTLQGAGGIGGLLARKDANGITFYHSDGNGNVTMLINSAGTMQAKYLYDSFGNPLGMWGPLAQANTYRFSSMETYDKAGVDLFAYRAYIPNLHRWPNQDPIGEAGGLNLYAYVGNNPVNRIDPLGLFVSANPDDANTVAQAANDLAPYLPHGGGVVASGSLEGGVVNGAGGTVFGGGGLFFGGNQGPELGGFSGYGGFVGGPIPLGGPTLKTPCHDQTPWVLGATASAGSGLFLTDATSAAQLGGPFSQWNLNLPWFSLSVAVSDGTWIGSLTLGPPTSASISAFPTTTSRAGGVSVNGNPSLYVP